MEPHMNETPEPGQLLLQLLALLGWDLSIVRGERILVRACRSAEGIEVEAVGRTLADASFYAYEQAFRALVERRETTLASAA
jgi:uncharacterized membrane protein